MGGHPVPGPQPGWRITSSVATVLLLLLFNLLPLVGVLFLGWDLLLILLMYWLESGVVGIINIAKIARAEGASDASGRKVNGRPAAPSKAILIPFFVLHYGIFWVVHGAFVLLLPLIAGVASLIDVPGRPAGPVGPAFGGSAVTGPNLLLGLAGLVLVHVVSYFYNYIGRGEYLTATPVGQMFAPYARVVVLHVTILAGAFLVFSVGQPVLLLALMVGLKTVIDLLLHLREHLRAAPAAQT